MKRILTLAAALLVCVTMFAKPVSRETARQVAVNFWRTTDRGLATHVDPVFQEISTELSLRGMYVFNTVENDGFVVVSANDVMTPILGYSTTNGMMRSTSMPSNLKGWLDHYTEEFDVVQSHGLVADVETTSEWSALINGTYIPKGNGAKAVNALIQTQWDQDSPYNNLCPLDGGQRSATGCVATAMAQVMKYWEWPTTGTGSHSYTSETNGFSLNVTFSGTTYDWSNMPAGGYNGYTYTPSSWTSTQKTAVATLMYHCGVSVDMDYTYEYGSGAYSSDAASALRTYFGYANGIYLRYKSQYTDANWISLLKTELDASRPMLYGGTNSTNDGGHSFICDGYNSSNQFHFNWGWSGIGDGFFSLSSLSPGTGGIGGGTYDFTYHQEAVVGISSPDGNPPDNPPDDPPTTSGLVTYSEFTVSSPVAYGSTITGTCGFANLGSTTFTGYLGVAAYSGSTLVAMLVQTNQESLESGSGGTIDISRTATSPLVGGTYTAKAVYSTDGSTWTPITEGYNGCATSVSFTITGGPDPGTLTYTLQTYDAFTLTSTTVAMGGTLSGTCSILNSGTGTFDGLLGVAAYNSSNQLVSVLDYGSVNGGLTSNHYVTFDFSATVESPFTPGNYTVKAVYSTNNGTSWNIITSGDEGCPTSVAFTIPGGGSNAINDVAEVPVRLYPNPTNGMLNVDVEGLQKVEVIDAVGRIVMSENSGMIDMSGLNNGIYSVRIIANGNTIVRKVAKQ